jgi:hypothetical protein
MERSRQGQAGVWIDRGRGMGLLPDRDTGAGEGRSSFSRGCSRSRPRSWAKAWARGVASQSGILSNRASVEMNELKLQTYESAGFLDAATNMIVRPPRQLYEHRFFLEIAGKVARGRVIQDFRVKFENHLLPVTVLTSSDTHCIIVYCHGNSSSKISALNLLAQLPDFFGLAAFDFANCGLAEVNSKKKGKPHHYLTLGLA